MSLRRWEPFGTFDEMFNRFPSMLGRWPSLTGTNARMAVEWSPMVDISETEGEFLIRAQLPAMKKEEVHVTFDDGLLTISGERTQKEEQKNEKVHRTESFYGSFARTFSLPDAIDAEAIRAETKDGILTVHIPKTKTEPKKAAEIKVQ